MWPLLFQEVDLHIFSGRNIRNVLSADLYLMFGGRILYLPVQSLVLSRGSEEGGRRTDCKPTEADGSVILKLLKLY